MKRNSDPQSSFPWLAVLLLAVVLSNCAGKRTIHSNGLYAIKIGEEMPAPGELELEGIPLQDTTFEDAEYEWRVAMMRYDDGLVYLEQDFFGSPNLNRIRIETPELKMRNGLRVGKTAADLLDKTQHWYVKPYPKFGVFEFYSEKYPRAYFLVSSDTVPMPDAASDAPPSQTLAREFSVRDTIVGIVLY